MAIIHQPITNAEVCQLFVTLQKVIENMLIRRADAKDLQVINKLLYEVEDIHRVGRPDLFRVGAKKYTDYRLLEIFKDDSTPVFVAEEEGIVLGYAFCQIQEVKNEPSQIDRKTLYLDDLCVDESARGKHVGSTLFSTLVDYARSIGCHNLTLHVWECNPSARKFYESMGMKPMSTTMETVL